MKNRVPSSPALKFLSLVMLTILMLTPAQPHFLVPQQVQAQITNNQPTQPYASVVNCIRSASNVNPANPSEASPRFAAACMSSAWNIASYEQPGDPANGDAPFTDAAVYEFGDGLPNASGEPGHTSIASIGTNGSNGGGIGLGSVYGLAYTSDTNPAAPYHDPAVGPRPRIYAGAFTKRVTRFGSGGPGAIYLLDRSTNNETLYVQIPGVVPGPLGAPGNPGVGSGPSFPNGTDVSSYSPSMGGVHSLFGDATAITFAGRTGLGDLDLDPQGRYLYGVNLLARSVFFVDTWSSNPQASIGYLPQSPIFSDPQSCNVSGAGGPQDLHPFGLGVTSTAVYLGFACGADSSQNRADLGAGVLRYRFATSSWDMPVAMALTSHDLQRSWPAPSFSNLSSWQPWKNDASGQASPLGASFRIDPQPIVSDISFDERGNMLIGMRDRFGDLGLTPLMSPTYPMAQGDLLVAAANGSGGWNMPGTSAEHFNDNSSFNQMPEEAAGALAYIPGEHSGLVGGEVISTMQDPYGANSGGTAWFNMGGGARQSSEELYTNFTAQHRFAKASGLGDVELLCDWRAIGDRIWRDSNSNGMQDAGEPDITGVLINLKDSSGSIIAQVTSASSNMTGNYRFYVNPYQSYTIEIDPSNYQAGGALFNLGPSLPNMGDDTLDNDADLNSRIAVPPAGASDVNISFDAGFTTGANVKISKSGPASAAVGTSFAYGLLYANDGPSTAQNVTITDTLPTGISLVSASPPPTSIAGAMLTWNLGSIGVGASATIVVNVQVDSSAPASVLNSTHISTSSSGNIPGDDDSSVTTQITRPNVWISKTGTASVVVGQPIAYTLSYGNNGTAPATNVAVVDTLPAAVSFVSASPAPSSVNGQVLTWNLGTLAAGATGSITVNVSSSAALANGTTLTNGGTITTSTPGDNPGDNSTSTSTTVQRADVYVTKSSTTSFPVVSGSSVSYSIDYGNNGPATAHNVTLSDPMPAQLSNITWQCTAGCSTAGTGSITSLALGDLAAGATGRIMVTGTATTTLAREDFTNTATVNTSTPEIPTTPDNNQSSVPGAVWTSDVQVIKTAGAQVTAGTTFTATLHYRNNGPAAAANVVLTDSLPAGATFVSSSPAPSSQSGQTLSWNLGTLTDGANGSVALVLMSDAGLAPGSTLVNQAHISTSTPDRSPGNNDSSSATNVITSADLRIVKVGPADVIVGDQVSYTITYTNDGPSVARSVVLTDSLPAELDFVSANPAPASQSNGVLTWNVGDLAVGSGSTITVVMQTKTTPQASNTIQAVNMVQIGSPSPDPTPGNNTSSTTTQIHKPEVAIAKAGPSQALAGDRIVYTLMYDNHGAAPAKSVVITDVLPTGMSYVSASPSPASINGQTLTWNIGDLAAGASGMIAIMVQIKADAPMALVNTATITTPSPGDDPGNNSSSTNTTIPYAGTIGDTVWRDDDGNGRMDLGEPGLPGVTIALSDAESQRLIATTRTDALGHYLFTGLGSGRYLLRVTAETTQIGSYRGYRLTTESLQSTVIDTHSLEDLDRDFGLRPQPTTDVSLTELHATANAQGTSISWRTIAETNTQRFRVLWSATADRNTASEIASVPSKGSQGGSYQLQHAASTGFFWLVEVEHGGKETLLGVCWPQEQLSQAPFSIFLPFVESAK